jgi:predicted flavoprotein YhiN
VASGGKHEPLDALVLGAGAARLAAARELSAPGRRVAVLRRAH